MLFLSIVINLIIAACLYPELFTKLDMRLVQGHETCGPMQYVFYLIGQFYQGNIQLFNRYDLLNGSYAQLSVGLYTPFNFVIALGYVVLSPFVKDPAQFFHHWYLLAFHGLGLILRTFGIYLLTRYMTKSRLTALITTILVNCFCAIAMIHLGGLCISSVYNYLPLLMFCLVYFWDTRSFKAVIASILVFLFAANNALYVGLGFFYQTVHLFLFDMLMIWLIFQRRQKPLVKDKVNWLKVSQACLVAILIFLPVIWWGTNVISDFEMVGTGLGGSEGRFSRIYNPHAMMHDPLRYFVSSQQVFSHAVDFTTSGWYLSGIFLGITIMVLSAIGLILGKHPYKPIFITAAIMMAFLNVPSNQGGWMMWAHWLDALTNPFCFLVRSFHYAVLLWYLTLAVPVCLGINACIAIIKKDTTKIYAKRINFIKGVLGSLIIACAYIANPLVKVYAMKVLVIFFIFFILFDLKQIKAALRVWLALALFTMVMAVEFSVLKQYINTPSVDMNGAYWDGLRVKPRVFSPMYTPPVPMILDYQNPRILPVRFFYRTDDQVVFPLLVEFQGMFGQFYQYMPLVLRLERDTSIYVPRLKVFKDINKDKHIQQYIRRDGRIMFMADAAILPNQDHFATILSGNLDRRIVQAEGENLDKVKNFNGLILPAPLPVNFKRNEYMFSLNLAKMQKKEKNIEYQWALPDDFPRYLSTTVFTPDVQLWQLSIGAQPLIPAQGALVAPFTFDVNNVRDGYLTVLMPATSPIKQDSLSLRVDTPEALLDVWRNTQDEFGFTYQVKRDGWWVMHMPYDPKWQLTIDGVRTPISKINGYFIGAPLKAGEHQILLTYWPDSPLRILIVVAVIAALIAMFIVFRKLYRWAHE